MSQAREPRVVVSVKEFEELESSAANNVTSYDQTLLLIRDLLSTRTIAFRREFVEIAGSASGALFLSQAMYWMSKTSDGWFYKTREEWTEETGLTRWEQESARKSLKAINVLQEVRKGCPFQLHFRINIVNIYSILSHNSQKKHGNSRSVENLLIDGGVPTVIGMKTTEYKDGNHQPYKEAEITTENTKEITKEVIFTLTSPEADNKAFEIPEWLPLKEWDEWKEDRKERKIPTTAAAQKKAINELDKLRKAGEDPVEVLSGCILRGWRGIFSIKSKYQDRPKPPVLGEEEDALAVQKRREQSRKKAATSGQ